MANLFIDFETYSEAAIKDCGVWVYAEHPSTEMLCMAYYDPEQQREPNLTTNAAEARSIIENAIRSGYICASWNAPFEMAIAYHLLGIEDALNPTYWEDTAARAAAHALPRALGDCGAALQLPQDQAKDKRGRYLIQRLCRPYRGKRVHDDALLQELYAYCRQDVIAEYEIHKRLPPLNDNETRIWQADQRINQRGVFVDSTNVTNALVIIEKQSAIHKEEVSAITAGELDSTNQRAAVMAYAEAHGYPMKGYTKADVDEAIADNNCPQNIKRLLQIRQQTGKTSTAKYQAFLNRSSEKDSRARGTLMYHGCSTGRWASSGINLQNIPRGSIADTEMCIELFAAQDPELIEIIYDDTMEALSSCLRGMIAAPAGKRLIVADYSAIEARVLAWLAGQRDVLEVFRTHGKLYEHAAASIYRKPIDSITKAERQIGKVASLALGYQGAGGAFHSMAANYGVNLPDEQVNQIVRDWRASNANIVEYWYALDRAAVEAVETGETTSARGVAFKLSGDFLYCVLPSKRKLAYYAPRIEEGTFGNEQVTYMGVNSYSRKWERQHIYGGKWAENIVQAVARDLMAEAILRTENAGYEIVLSVHDELIAEVPDDFGSVEEFEKLMCELPTWAKGLPLNAEGWAGKRYRK